MAKKKEVYTLGRGLVMLYGVLFVVLGVVILARPEMIEEVIGLVLVVYGVKKIVKGYKYC